MKKYIRYILYLLICLCWFACADFINVQPENGITYTNYFKTQKDAEALLAALENRVRSMMTVIPSYMTNLAFSGEIVDKDDWDIFNQAFKKNPGKWQNYYSTIYQADLIIDNAHRFEMKEEEIKPYILQAYFAKGVAYLYLAMNFGEVPIIQWNANFGKFPQSPVGAVLDEAEKWALKAMELPKYEDMVKQTTEKRMKQHAGKGTVAALLAHIYAWKAGVEGKSECWEKAEEYCRMIIDGEVGAYKLAANPEEVCTSVMKGNSDDAIWEIYYNAQDDGWRRDLTSNIVGFPVVESSSLNKYPRFAIYKTTVREMYEEGDRRRNAYFWGTDDDSIYLVSVNGKTTATTQKPEGVNIIHSYDNQEYEQAFLFKFRYPFYTVKDGSAPQFNGMDQYQVVWRLAEIYLLRAECRARQGKTTAADDLNVIRRNAYGDDSHAFPNASDIAQGLNSNLQLAIFREREKELLLEYHRYFDIMRNGWCHLRGEDSYDYIRKELSSNYADITNQDILDGALYYELHSSCFEENDLIRQNKYWNRRQ